MAFKTEFIMNFKVYTTEEAKKRSGHFWDTITPQFDYEDMSYELASIFASKSLTINWSMKPIKPSYNSYSIYKKKWISKTICNDSTNALYSKIAYAFDEKLGIKISMKYGEYKTIKWYIQFDQNFSWLIVQDLKTGLKLVFENE